MKRMVKRALSVILTVAMLLSCSALAFTAGAWNAAPVNEVDMSLKLVGMMNMKIFQDSPYIANVSTAATGELSGVSLYAYKFSGTGTSIGKNWPHQMGDGPYTEEQFQDYFGVDCINECMQINEQEVAVYMLYDLGDPNSQTVQNNMTKLGITDINEYYKLMANDAKISIGAYAGGGTAHETAITAYYRFSDDWRTFAKSNSGKYVPRATLEGMGIAAPNENRYFFETQESQKRLDGGDAFPGVFDESVQQYIDHKQSYSLPVWEDENEDASWNIINPVPTCNIYSRWGTEYDKDTTYEEIKAIKDQVIVDKYGENYTDGQWYGYTDDQVRYYDGLDIDDMIVPKNWEWEAMPYYSTKSGTTYSATTASKSHLGYGEYCPAATKTYHDFYLPQNQATDEDPSRFLTVMVRETGTMCGLDGSGHWHSVKVDGVSTTSIIKFEPELNDDQVVIDYGLSTEFSVDANDWVWTTDPYARSATLPAIADIKITSGNPENEAGYSSTVAYGKYGTLELTDWDNSWGDGHCNVKYTPKCIVNDVDTFYYKVYPNESDIYEPMYAKITVVPASVVYYEDNFSANDSADANYQSSLNYTGSWTSVDNGGNEIQATAVNGTQQLENTNYGYDLYYENDFGYSDSTAHKANKGDTLSFTFKGTGCDIIMRTDAADGTVKYSATKSAILSDGSMSGTSTEAMPLHSVSCRNDNGKTLYQLPVVSLRFDDLAYYTVTITSSTSRPIYVDGVRVYNPLGIYNEIGSDNETMDAYYDQLEKYAVMAPVYDLIYNSHEMKGSVGFIGMYDNWNEWYGVEKNIDGEETDFDSHLSIGPNNEIYLAPGQSLVFNVTNSDLSNLLFDIEAKGLSAPTVMTVSIEGKSTGTQAITVNSNTAMYYKYDINNSGIGSSGAVKIQNSGSEVLALSNLKFSKILGTEGKIYYQFVKEDGTPVEGVQVVVRNSKGETVAEVTTDASGEFSCDGLPVGTYKAYIVTPKGISSVKSRTISVSETSVGENQRFVLRDIDLEIGSAPEVWHSATVETTTTHANFHDFNTYTEAGSFTVACEFDGTSTGYFSDKYYLNGNLVIVANSDGTATYSFAGTGKANRKSVTSTSGTLTNVVLTDDKLSIDYNEVFTKIFDTNVVTDINKMMPNGFEYSIQAYEYEDASISGEYGDYAIVTIGDAGHITAIEKATLNYTFEDEQGNPVEGVKVTVDGQTVVSGADGKVTVTNVSLGDQTVTFETPKGLSNIKAENLSFDPWNREHSDSYTLVDFDLTIGSDPSLWHTPSVEMSTTTATFKDCQTYTDAGSYKVEYVFDGVAGGTGYSDKNNYLNGKLTVIVNDAGTATYSFNGSGKGNGNNFGAKSGTTNAASVDSNGNIVIDYISLWNTISNTTGRVNDISRLMPSGSDFSVTAYEYANTQGDNGNTATVTIGQKGEVTSEQKATVSYSFEDEDGNPVAGVKVTVDGQTATSGADGSVTITGISLEDQTVTFETPKGLSNVRERNLYFDPENYTDTDSFVLREFDLTIGSDPDIWHTPSVSLTTTTATFNDCKTYTDAGSYKIEYVFDGTTSGRLDKDVYISGTLTVIVNSNGSATYELNGGGKNGGKNFTGKSGTSYLATSINSDGSIDVDYYTILALATGVSGKFTDITKLMPNGTDFTITAYEQAGAQGEHGNTAALTVGVEGEVISLDTATLSYTFLDDDGAPIENVQVYIDGEYVGESDENGIALISDVELGDHEVSFKSPKGKSKIKSKKIKLSPDNTEDNETFNLTNISYNIGSGDNSGSVYSEIVNNKMVINNCKPSAEAGSYTVSYTFDGKNGGSGYVNNKTYIQGTLTVTVNADGTAAYSFNGSGKAGNKNFGSKSGTTAAVAENDGTITVDYFDLLNVITNSKDQFGRNLETVMPANSDLSVTAYEKADAQGEHGNTAVIDVNGTINTGSVESIVIADDEPVDNAENNTVNPVSSFFNTVSSVVASIIEFILNIFKR